MSNSTISHVSIYDGLEALAVAHEGRRDALLAGLREMGNRVAEGKADSTGTITEQALSLETAIHAAARTRALATQYANAATLELPEGFDGAALDRWLTQGDEPFLDPVCEDCEDYEGCQTRSSEVCRAERAGDEQYELERDREMGL